MSDQIRLLLCLECKSLQPLPDYEGDPHNDWDLKYLIEKHEYASGDRHKGNLIRLPKNLWDDPKGREEITKQIKDGLIGGGLPDAFYDVKDTLNEDAMTCFSRHGRNPACSDYRSDSKRLSAGTDKARKDLGLAPLRSNRFLCDHCPVHSLVLSAANKDL